MTATPLDILLVEDSRPQAVLLQEMLQDDRSGAFHVTWVDCLAKAIAAVKAGPYDAVLLDLTLPDSSGMATLSILQQAAPGVPIVVVTGLQDEATGVQAIRRGAQDYLVKDKLTPFAIRRAIRYAIDRMRSEKQEREALAMATASRAAVEILEAIGEGVLVLDMEGYITSVNPATEALTGIPAAEALGRPLDAMLSQALPPSERGLAAEALAMALQGQAPDLPPLMILTRDGGHTPVIPSVAFVRAPGGKPTAIVVTLRDISALRAAQQLLVESEQKHRSRLRELTDRIAATEEQERRRIASQIHDTVIQTLSLSTIRMGALRAALQAAGLPEQVEKLEQLRRMVDTGISECRGLMGQLTPPLLYELGLGAALKDYAEKLHKLHGVTITVQTPSPAPPLDDAQRGFLFQAARELLMNALKHAGDARISVSLAAVDAAVHLTVTDTGRGFEPGALNEHMANYEAGGFGLFNIRERLHVLGGELTIDSAPGKGAAVTVRLPLTQAS